MSVEDEFEEYETLMLTDDNGEESEFMVIDNADCDGQNYILVIEVDIIGDDDADAIILKKLKEDDEESYEIIEDDDEFDKIAALFAERVKDYDLKIEE